MFQIFKKRERERKKGQSHLLDQFFCHSFFDLESKEGKEKEKKEKRRKRKREKEKKKTKNVHKLRLEKDDNVDDGETSRKNGPKNSNGTRVAKVVQPLIVQRFLSSF